MPDESGDSHRAGIKGCEPPFTERIKYKIIHLKSKFFPSRLSLQMAKIRIKPNCRWPRLFNKGRYCKTALICPVQKSGFRMMLQRLIILLALSVVPSLFAQFDHFSLEHGLSQTTVMSIWQDRQGYLWFGTSDGLNKYDGYSFTVYRNDPLDLNSLADNVITAIGEDGAGALWVGTISGVLHRFNRQAGRFWRYKLPLSSQPQMTTATESVEVPYTFSFFSDQTITVLYADSQNGRNNLWIGTWRSGLYKLDLQQLVKPRPAGDDTTQMSFPHGALTHYQYDPGDPHSLSDNHIRAICRDRSGRFWIGTFGGGLNRFDEASQRFQHFRHDASRPHSLSADYVLSLCEDRAGTLWIGTLGGGLNQLMTAASTQAHVQPPAVNVKFTRSAAHKQQNHLAESMRFVHYRHDPANPYSLSDNDVTTILEDRYQTLWLGTFGGGLNRMDRLPASALKTMETTVERFTHFQYDRLNPHSFLSNDVLSMHEDRTGILWIGSQLGAGISKYDRRKEKFKHYKNELSDPSSLNDNVIWSIFTTSKGDQENIWVGTYYGGLNLFDRRRGRFTHFRHDPADPHSLSHNHVRSICEDAEGALWIGTFGEGLNKCSPPALGKFTHYKHDPANLFSLSDNHVRTIFKDHAGTLWIGTLGGGLNRFDAKTGRFFHYRHNPLDPNSLSDDRVYTIYEDRRGTLWIGTFGGGLNQLFIPHQADRNFDGLYFVQYKFEATDSNTLSDDRVMSICEDRDGVLWIGTFGGGLNRFDRASGKFTRLRKRAGPPSDVIYGILEDEGGELWISSNQGLARFNPRTLACKNYDERDGLQSNEFSGGAYAQSRHGEMFFGGINGLNCFFPDSVKDNLFVPPVVITAVKKFNEVIGREVKKIELAYADNFFSLEFAVLDFANPAKNQYAYYLEGFDPNWIFSGTRHTASYTNLDPGHYTFRVKGANNDGVWNETGAVVNITIHPPFWKTWWLRALAAGLFVTLILLSHKYRVRQKITQMLEIERIRKIENERLRKQVADDFHDEFGQKLTNIALFAEIIKRNLNGTAPQTAAHLNKITDAATSLSDGMRDFIWTLDRNNDSFYNVASRIKDFGESLFAKTKISFAMSDFSPAWENIPLSMDWKRHVIQIFKEGMKNSLKHGECTKVMLDIALTGKTLTLRLTDDGKGFENSESVYGAGLRYMKKRAGKIGGELKIISQPGQGTTIQLSGRIPHAEPTIIAAVPPPGN
ncbi:MAG: hypothetical protein ALAOOOJD_01806 [bacterium]|nr:hypothetical protein [bacterium]